MGKTILILQMVPSGKSPNESPGNKLHPAEPSHRANGCLLMLKQKQKGKAEPKNGQGKQSEEMGFKGLMKDSSLTELICPLHFNKRHLQVL